MIFFIGIEDSSPRSRARNACVPLPGFRPETSTRRAARASDFFKPPGLASPSPVQDGKPPRGLFHCFPALDLARNRKTRAVWTGCPDGQVRYRVRSGDSFTSLRAENVPNRDIPGLRIGP